MRRVAQILSFVLAAVVAPAAAESVFPIIVEENGVEAARGLGVLVAEERLLTSAALLAQGDRYLVEGAAGADPLEAEAAAGNADTDLALVSAPGLDGGPVTPAKQASGAARQVYLLFPEGNRREGVMHSIGDVYRFTAAPGEHGAGAPLMNNCGELLAVSRMKPENPAGGQDASAGVSGILPEVRAFLEAHKVAFENAAAECPSLKQQIAEREEAEKKLQAEIAEKEQQLGELRQNEGERREEAAKLVGDLDGLRKSLEDSRESTKDLQARLEKIGQEIREKDEAIENLEERKKDLEQEKRLLWIAGAGAGAPALLIGALMVRRLRQRRQALRQFDAELAAARVDLARNAAAFSDVILFGKGTDGREMRIKINGCALARSDAGQVIGRASADADYVITLNSVSRRHARLRVADGAMTIEDMNSLNGTSVNGVELQPGETRVIRNGARTSRWAAPTFKLVFSRTVRSETEAPRDQHLLHVRAGPVRFRHGRIHPAGGSGADLFPQHGRFRRTRREDQ